ncbi:MAG: ABC transporter permease [Opitutaceae bacterium]
MRFALRQFLKDPGFTAIALLTLALGIGVNTIMFTVANAVLYRMPAFRDPDRLVRVFATTPQQSSQGQSPANVRDELRQNDVFERAAAYNINFASLGHPGEPAERIGGLQVGGEFFRVLGVNALIGRTIRPDDDRVGHADVVDISEQFWTERFNRDPRALGAVLRIDGKPSTVIGVIPASCQDIFSWAGRVDLWQPHGYDAATWNIRDNPWLAVVARLRPGVSLGRAQAEIRTIGERLARDHPNSDAGMGLRVSSYEEARNNDFTRRICWLILGLAGAVLVIACVNLANLQLARTVARTREHAIRIALGASRAQLIRQLLLESVLLSIAGGVLGLLVAIWGNRIIGRQIEIGPYIGGDRGFDLPIDYRVLAFLAVASVATGVVFGLMPAWLGSRADVNAALKQGARGATGGRSKHRARNALVVAELALALGLLAGAACFVRGIQRLGGMEVHWNPENLLTGNFILSYNTYTNDDQVRKAVDRMRSELLRLPGADHAAISGMIPIYVFSRSFKFLVEGAAPPEKGREPLVEVETVTPGYFATLGIRLREGRAFSRNDRADSPPCIVVSEALAKQYWPRGDAIGHRIRNTDPNAPGWMQIVGVVDDVRFPGNPSVQPTRFQAYRPFAQDPQHWLALTVRSRGDSAGLARAVKGIVTGIDPDMALYGLGTVQGTIDRSSRNVDVVGWMLTFSALLGLLLALVGIYGVIANLGAQRTQEIGIRLALGAQVGAVVWLVLRAGLRLALIGTALGLALAFVIERGIGATMPEIPGEDPFIVVGLAALLMGAALLASWMPARRATRVNAVDALRTE